MYSKNNLRDFIISALVLLGAAFSTFVVVDLAVAQEDTDWMGFAGNFDIGYRKTQFFEPHHDAAVGTWDTRVELWLPPSRKSFSWGPYLRVAGIGASRDDAWENAWLAGPGMGFQLYPFSLMRFRTENSLVGKVLGPLRLFAEYNWMDYWGNENAWRPDHQVKVGGEYWRNLYANDVNSFWWAEIWGGLYWQSANEFNPNYDTMIFAASFRSGIRIPDAGIFSIITPYVALETATNRHDTYYWDNRLLIGSGLRIAPSLQRMPSWFNRIVAYAEYDYVAAYYRQHSYPDVPDHDLRIGLSFSLGDWYH